MGKALGQRAQKLQVVKTPPGPPDQKTVWQAAPGLTHGYFLHVPVPALELTAMVEGLLHD